MNNLVNRMIRAAKLDASLYEEVEHDTTLTLQAMVVVVISSVAAGLGTLGIAGLPGILGGAVLALTLWYLWAFITYWVGTRLLPETQTSADHGELLRTIGFASSPGVLRLFAFMPLLGPLIFFVSSIWMLAATVVAVRQALDYTSTLRAFVVCVIGWIIQFMIMAIVTTACGIAGSPIW